MRPMHGYVFGGYAGIVGAIAALVIWWWGGWLVFGAWRLALGLFCGRKGAAFARF